MFCRASASPQTVKFSARSAHRYTLSVRVWCQTRALAQHIISTAICKINYLKRGIIMTDKFVTLAHGAGGKQTSELIDRVFKEHFANPDLTADDAAVLSMERAR